MIIIIIVKLKFAIKFYHDETIITIIIIIITNSVFMNKQGKGPGVARGKKC